MFADYNQAKGFNHDTYASGFAHKHLNEAVFAAYGWPGDLSANEILERLLKLNLERS